MFDHDPHEKKEPVDYTGLKLVILLAPLLLIFFYFDKADLGLTVFIVLGMIILDAKLRWNLRRRIWFWATIVLILVPHVPLVFLVRWPHGNVPMIYYALPLGTADFAIISGILGIAEKIFSKDY